MPAFNCDYHAQQALDAAEITMSGCLCPHHVGVGDASAVAAVAALDAGKPGPLVRLLRSRLESQSREPVGGGEAPLTQRPDRYLKSATGRLVAPSPVDGALLQAFYRGCINGLYGVGTHTLGEVGYENGQLVPTSDDWLYPMPAAGDQLSLDDAISVRDTAITTAASVLARKSKARPQSDVESNQHRSASVLARQLRDLTPSETRDRVESTLRALKSHDPRRYSGLLHLRQRNLYHSDERGRPVRIDAVTEIKYLDWLVTMLTDDTARTPKSVAAAVHRCLARKSPPARWVGAATDPDVAADLMDALAAHVRCGVPQRSVKTS